MGFQDAVRSFLTRWNDFRGRSSRSEYWWAYLGYMLAIVAGIIVCAILGAINDTLGTIAVGLLLLADLALIVPSLAIGFRRLHDIDKSAWWLLIALVPLVGPIVLLIFYVTPGTAGPNQYGQNPLTGGAEAFA